MVILTVLLPAGIQKSSDGYSVSQIFTMDAQNPDLKPLFSIFSPHSLSLTLQRQTQQLEHKPHLRPFKPITLPLGKMHFHGPIEANPSSNDPYRLDLRWVRFESIGRLLRDLRIGLSGLL
ncbi:hypothetical protein U1Q18_032219 [Sarracenia purpurea var. burkii]